MSDFQNKGYLYLYFILKNKLSMVIVFTIQKKKIFKNHPIMYHHYFTSVQNARKMQEYSITIKKILMTYLPHLRSVDKRRISACKRG